MRCLLRLGLLASGCAAYNGYEVGTDPSTYQEAAAYCASVGGALASIYSDADNEAARGACGYQACWIGLRESGGDHTTHAVDQTWLWQDNSTTAGYHNWAPSEPDNGAWNGAAYDRRRAVMNGAGDYGFESSGLWFTHSDTWSTYVPLCSVDVPTAAPTISPAPTLTPVPTFLFQCNNTMCGFGDCCAEYPDCMDGSTPVIKDGHKCRVGRGSLDNLGRGDVIYGDLFTCCTGFRIPTDEELTASGFAWEDHKNHNKDSEGGGGDGWGMQFLIVLCVLMGICVIAAVAIVVGISYGGCCEPTAPKPRTARASARAVELVPTAHAVEVPAAAGGV